MTTKKASAADPVRFAVIGQGHFAQSAILPAFANARGCELTALFSDDPTKLRALKKRYDVEYALPYDQLSEFLATRAVDAVYIAVPNDLHAAFAESAAGAGVHVLCEKPIAASSAQAERMIAACERGGVKLMIAYRLHFEEANLSATELVRSGKIGEPRFFSAIFSQQVTPDNTRTKRVHAGGPLRDVGIYCINAARYLFRDEPTEAVALSARKAGDARFQEIDEQVSALLRFPGDRLAQLTCSFGAYKQSAFTVVGTKGRLRLSPAFNMSDLVLEVEVDGKTKQRRFKKRDQVAPELDEFAACIREDRDPEPSGREGLADLRVIEAIEASARNRGRVEVSRVFPERRPSIRQARRRPAHGRAETINVRGPSQQKSS
ncbi:MAG TPA: Gfo/Idh/MocA family oxidoreductase [Polyangia bacterium]|nr:Gfo/Idh/MocA family oxidoreductase [Polyangia bacterium]